MRLKSLQNQMLVAVSSLVMVSGFLISLLVTERYTRNLLETMTVQAKQVAQAIELDTTERILTNDLVGLQKTLEQHTHDNSAMSYLFIQRDKQVLAHTFETGFPIDLLNANHVAPGDQAHTQRITSRNGERYLDVAWPIFTSDAGVLRLGFSEEPYRRSVTGLWLQMIGLTLAILLFALGGTLFFVRRITRPLAVLVQATRNIGNDGLKEKVRVNGQEEVATLSSSFNQMVARMGEYTRQLEEQTVELERSYQQTRNFCGIVQEIGSMRSLNEIGSFMINKIADALKCCEMVLLLFNGNRDLIYTLSSGGVKTFKDPEVLQNVSASLDRMQKVPFQKRTRLHAPLVPEHFQSTSRQGIVPFPNDNQPDGFLVIACSDDCRCNPKEIDMVRLILNQASGVIKRAVLQEDEINDLRRRLETPTEFSGIVGKDPKLQMIYKLIQDIAPTDASVLIQGENGSGKEVVAQAIHNQSHRSEEPFVVINCSAFPTSLLESELFGHEKGAFTGAIRQKPGRFEQAQGGTIFLDEIGEISSSAQVKLLRVLQARKFERLGGEQTIAVDVRILAATNKDLQEEVKNGHFREDLFYRLNVIPINIPPLRERRNDIPLLSNHFLIHYSTEHGKKIEKFSTGAMRLLLDYPWPGNVRELKNSIEHAVVLAKGERIEESDLPAILHSQTDATLPAQSSGLSQTMAEHERTLLHQVLIECGWNKKLAASRLGISRNTLYEKLKKHQIMSPATH
jgi:two-component system response regulator HydG